MVNLIVTYKAKKPWKPHTSPPSSPTFSPYVTDDSNYICPSLSLFTYSDDLSVHDNQSGSILYICVHKILVELVYTQFNLPKRSTSFEKTG